jgi:beta-glucosidase
LYGNFLVVFTVLPELNYDDKLIFFDGLLMITDGLGTKVNEEGINYYNNVINALLEKGMILYLISF